MGPTTVRRHSRLTALALRGLREKYLGNEEQMQETNTRRETEISLYERGPNESSLRMMKNRVFKREKWQIENAWRQQKGRRGQKKGWGPP